MGADFREAMRGQFDAGQERFAGDPFAAGSAHILGRVRRRRTLANAAVGGGTVVAVGAIAVAAMYLPRGSSDPAATPLGCVTWSPSPDPYPVATISPDPSDFSYDVTLPDGAGVMNLVSSYGRREGLDVTLPDGTTFTAPADPATGAFVFKIPDLHVVVVAISDFRGNLKVSVGGVDAVISSAPGDKVPRVVATATPEPLVDCGTTTEAAAVVSPFACGFHMDSTYRDDAALTITGAGVKTVAEASAMVGDPNLTVNNPVVANIEPLVPYITAVNNEVPAFSAGTGRDPAAERVDPSMGATTGVAVVKVQNGVVVAVPNEAAVKPGVSRGQVLVGEDGVSVFILDTDYFATCPGVTSTAYAALYAVAGSQTLAREEATEPAIYVWQQLRGTIG